MGLLLFITFLTLGLVGIGAGAIKAGSNMSTYARNTAYASEATPEELGRLQIETNQGMIGTMVGTAEAALSAQTLAGPGVSPNPVGLGFTEGMTIGQKICEISEGRAQAIDQPATAGTPPTGSQPQTNVQAAGTTPTAQGRVNVAEAPDEDFIAWYADNIGYNPIWISSVHEFNMYEKSADYPGGGIDPTIELQKIALTGAYNTRAEALTAVRSMMTDERVMSGIYAGQRVATIGSETHNLEFLGIMSWWE